MARWRGVVWLVGANLLWSGNMLVGRALAPLMAPTWSAFLRWVVGALFLTVLWLRAGKRPALDLRHVWLGLSGMVLFNWLMFGSLALTTATESALVYAATPALIGLFAIVLDHERLGPRRWIGLALSIVGAAIVAVQGPVADLTLGLGAVLMFLASLAWAFYTAYGRRATVGDMDVLSATTYAAWLSLPLLLVGALVARPAPAWPPVPAAVELILYSGLLAAGVAFVWWNDGVRQLGLGVAGPFANLLPVFTPLLAAIFLGERVGLRTVVGGVIVLLGAVLATLPGSTPSLATDSAGK